MDRTTAQSQMMAEIARLAESAGGIVGVAARRLDGAGPRVDFNSKQSFPMASVYKVAIAGAVLAAVDDGRLELSQMIEIDPALAVPSEVIADRFIHRGVSLSVQNLLEIMLVYSDNTATDVLMQVVGGAEAVTQWVRAQGVQELRVDRDTGHLLRDFYGLPPGPFKDVLAAAFEADPQLEQRSGRAHPPFDDDPRDTATPEAMTQLLTSLFGGRTLSASSTELLTAIMGRCQTGQSRLKGQLPIGTIVAHKTGTVGGTINDAGVITLPANLGHVVVTVFIKKSDLPIESRERAIAEIARSIRDYYLFLQQA